MNYICGICKKSYDTHDEAFKCFMNCNNKSNTLNTEDVIKQKDKDALIDKIKVAYKELSDLCDKYNKITTELKLSPNISQSLYVDATKLNSEVDKLFISESDKTSVSNISQNKKTCNKCSKCKSKSNNVMHCSDKSLKNLTIIDGLADILNIILAIID